MRDFLKSFRFKVLVAILLVMLGFMVAAVYSGGTAPIFARLTGFVTVPAQAFSANVSNSVAEFLDQFVNAKATYAENQLLRQQVIELHERLADYERVKHENEQYQAIIGIKEQQPERVFVSASVISRDALTRFYSFTIDKGSLEGIKLHDPVITAEGLVGYVSEVGYNYAKVLTILDVTVDVGVYNSMTRDIGIVTGTIDLASQGRCQMELLPRDSETAVGDLILTSGGFSDGASLFPKDILIGTVLAVEPNAHGTSPAAIIQPAADIQNVKDVFVITEFEGRADPGEE